MFDHDVLEIASAPDVKAILQELADSAGNRLLSGVRLGTVQQSATDEYRGYIQALNAVAKRLNQTSAARCPADDPEATPAPQP